MVHAHLVASDVDLYFTLPDTVKKIGTGGGAPVTLATTSSSFTQVAIDETSLYLAKVTNSDGLIDAALLKVTPR